jgi:glycosyltransferase involved in cell wall biosynthesis
MSADRIVLVNATLDQGDILADYLQWNLDLGVDSIIVQDKGSTDESRDVLDRFEKTKRLAWYVLPERNMLKYNTSQALAAMARERFEADWIIYCDADEFLCPQGEDLRTILRRARRDGVTVLTVPCFNMTGPVPTAGQRATQVLTLRIDRPVMYTDEQIRTGILPVPYGFVQHLPKTIVRAAALVDYGPGTHNANSSWGRNESAADLKILHYPYRRFEKFKKKVQNAAAWLNDNPHLEQGWGWHWRRLVKLDEQALVEEFERQFVSPEQAQELVRDGTCTVDETVAKWLDQKSIV